MSGTRDWAAFWSQKAAAPTDFEATGRRRMDVVGFLYTVRECARLLELRREDRLLDIGCGTGIVALALSPMVHAVHGVELSPVAAERAARNLSDVAGARVEVGSILDLPVGDASADKALAYSVLQYLPDADAVGCAFAEVARALVPGGIALFAANPDPTKMDAYLDAFAGPEPAARERERGFQRDLLWLAPDRMAALAGQAGLAARIEPIHPRIQQAFYMFDLVAVKP